jgi:hypothetical protein
MSELLQVIIVVAFGALCFGGGYLTAFIVTRNHGRDEMIVATPATTGTPANGNGESRRKNRRRGECDDPNPGGIAVNVPKLPGLLHNS